MEREDGPILLAGKVISREIILYMAEQGAYIPDGFGLDSISLHNWGLIVDLVNKVVPPETPAAPTSETEDIPTPKPPDVKPVRASCPAPGTPNISRMADPEQENDHEYDEDRAGPVDPSYRYVRPLSYANSPYPRYWTQTDNHAATFGRFKTFPRAVRRRIWMHAADAADASRPTVFDFAYRKVALSAGRGYAPLSSSVFYHMYEIRPGGQPCLDIRELMRASFRGHSVLTFTPSPAVAEATLEIRNVLRCCPEARDELLTHRRYRSCFGFHWAQGRPDSMLNLGTIRPFCYGEDWITLDGLDYLDARLGFGRPGDPGVLCTPDLGRVRHFAFPYRSAPEHDYVPEHTVQLDVLYRLEGLRSVGFYRPSFVIGPAMVPLFERVITESQRLFLRGIPGPPPLRRDASRPPELNENVFRTAMLRLERLVRAVRDIARDEGWHQQWLEGRRSAFAALKFCFLVYAESQEALDLMKFREDGSHLDAVSWNWLDDPQYFGRVVKGLEPSGQ